MSPRFDTTCLQPDFTQNLTTPVGSDGSYGYDEGYGYYGDGYGGGSDGYGYGDASGYEQFGYDQYEQGSQSPIGPPSLLYEQPAGDEAYYGGGWGGSEYGV
eukprot:TRINITY_DN66606_c5_g4_i3.p2 TRINITY_DN66606_c5_g4~~TRINITY_DN66606_c5_g4_i3.p2  ORF type:complete len:101 (-),score=18.68 TRINITY_DN66606_c5_g4_i3:107-409(-)